MMAPPSVVAGGVLEFLYRGAHGFAHRSYDDFPYGRRVHAFETYVDLHATILIETVKTSTFDGKTFVGVQFQARSGMLRWTNFFKDDDAWLRVVQNGCQPESRLKWQWL